MCSNRIHNCFDMMWIWYTSLSLSVGNIRLMIHRRKLSSLHLLHMLLRLLLLREWLVSPRCLLLKLETFIGGQLNFWRAWKIEKLTNMVTRLLIHYFFLSISFIDLQPSLFAVLANDLQALQKALSNEKVCLIWGRELSGWGEGCKTSCWTVPSTIQRRQRHLGTWAGEHPDLSCCYSWQVW
jgi:hypothetical protein